MRCSATDLAARWKRLMNLAVSRWCPVLGDLSFKRCKWNECNKVPLHLYHIIKHWHWLVCLVVWGKPLVLSLLSSLPLKLRQVMGILQWWELWVWCIFSFTVLGMFSCMSKGKRMSVIVATMGWILFLQQTKCTFFMLRHFSVIWNSSLFKSSKWLILLKVVKGWSLTNTLDVIIQLL